MASDIATTSDRRGTARQPRLGRAHALTWTGNHFLSERLVQDIVRREALHTPFTTKGPPNAQPLRDALSAAFGIDAEWIAIGAGSSQVIDALLRCFHDHEIVDVVPNFHMACLTARRSGLAYRAVIVRDPEELLDAVRRPRSRRKRLLILSSPRNPLGYNFPLRAIVELAGEWPGPVVVDEAYVEFSPDPKRLLALLTTLRNLVLVRTFSKAWGLANLRVGYAMSQLVGSRLRDEFILPCSVGELSIRVACAMLRSPERVMRSIASTVAAREHLRELLLAMPGLHVWQSDANFLCLEHERSAAIAQQLRKRGLITTILHGLRHFPAHWPPGIRVAVPPLAVAKRLVAALQEALVETSRTPRSERTA